MLSCRDFREDGWRPLTAENLGRFYLSTVRCAVKRNTSSRRRQQLHPASFHYAVTSRRPSGPHAARRADAQRRQPPDKLRRSAVRGRTTATNKLNAGRNGDFLPKVLLSRQKNRRYAYALLRDLQKNGVADRTRTDGLLGHNQTL